jgi:hypothetical protein
LLVVLKQHAQTRFSLQYNFGQIGSPHLSVNVFTATTGYLLAGYTSNTLTNVNKGFGIIATDFNGNQLWQKQTASANGLQYSNNTATQAFIQLQNKNILYTGQQEIVLNYTKACLARINHNTGDTLWTKQYTQPGDTCYLLCSTELSDSSIIVFGFRYYTCITCNNNSKPFMMKVDKNGNYKWHKWINNNFSNTKYLFQKVIKLSDNDFVVVGYKYSNICNPQSFVMRIDTMASKAYDINLTGLQYPVISDATKLQDGTILAVGGYIAVSNCSALFDKYKKFAYKINPLNGTKISSKTYGQVANAEGAFCVAQQTNGIIYIGGAITTTTQPNSVNYYSNVLKLKSNLDSVTNISFEDAGNDYSHNTNQLILTPDGGFAAVIASYPNASQQQYWLIKADSNGCYQSLCPTVGLNDVSLSGVEDWGVRVYPNPVKDLLFVEVSHASTPLSVTSETPTSFSLTNALGQVIKEDILRDPQQPIEINVKDLQEGIYFLQIKSEGKILVNKKFVIER